MRNFWNLRLNKKIALFFWLSTLFAHAQSSDPEVGNGKDEKYLYPVNPGQPGSLAGNMGELRTTHFHSGIDVRTNNMIGAKVHASKSGYITRVSMSPSGYGNIIYVKHPDGNTTLYAHLDHFVEPLATHVLQEQYFRKTFSIDLTFDKNQFPVKQRDVIAISGNSGSSGGPHLHFDIRNSDNLALNPLLFKFPEIKDQTPPLVEKVALTTLDINSRINDQYGRFEFYAYRSGNDYTIASPILAYGNIGVEVLAKDKFLLKDQFFGGVNYIDMRVNGVLHFKQAIEQINTEETRGIYTLMDYKVLRTTGKRFYKLYLDDGNTLPFYESTNKGKIHVDPKKDTRIELFLRDAFANTTKVAFNLRPSPLATELKNLSAPREPNVDIDENIMSITTKKCLNQNTVTVYQQGGRTLIYPSYASSTAAVFLIDLRKNLPDSILVCEKSIITNLITTIPSTVDYKYYSDWIDITFSADALYDTLFLRAKRSANGEVYTVGDRSIPLNKSITISLKPSREYTKDKRLAVYRKSGNSYAYLGGEWINGRINFQTRELGDFVILTDYEAPRIQPILINSYKARLKIRDDLSGIQSYEATLNGEWLLMHYDAKTATIWSEQLDKSQPLKGQFKLDVTDNAGNIETFTSTIQ